MDEGYESDGATPVPQGVRIKGSNSQKKRAYTPEQRKVSVQKNLRERTNSRREGHQPQRLAYKVVPEEQIRLAKKINATFKHSI